MAPDHIFRVLVPIGIALVAGNACGGSSPASAGAGIRGDGSSSGSPSQPGAVAILDATANGEMDASTLSDAASEAGSDAADACAVNSDCASGEQCLYKIGDCSARGQCVLSGAECGIAVGCSGCSDGQIVAGLCGLPSYAYGPALRCSP